jgi:hypothetical protein
METAAMESEVPPTDAEVPAAAAPAPPESAHDRHLREMESSFEALEDTVEHGLVRVVKIAVPAVVGLLVAVVGVYTLGGYLRDRAERKRVARAMLIVEAERIRRRRRRRSRRESVPVAAS